MSVCVKIFNIRLIQEIGMSAPDIEDKFYFEEFQKQAREKVMNGQSVTGKNGVLTPLIKKFFETFLEAELIPL